jgi:glutathione S-transferase
MHNPQLPGILPSRKHSGGVTYMLKVWGRKTSVNVQKVMWTIGELGLECERIDAGGPFGKTDTAEFAGLNPNRLVPVIEDNGLVLWESNAIVRHLARAYGNGRLAPSDSGEFAKADQWMDWALSSLYPEIIGTLFNQYVRVTVAGRDAQLIAAALKRAGQKLAILDAQLAHKAFILGDDLTMADMAAGVLMYRYYTLPIERPTHPNVEAWYGRLAERRAYQDQVMIDWSQMKVPGA